MDEPAPPRAVVRLVDAMSRWERAGGGAARADDSDVAQHIVARLRQELGRVIGPAGFDVLLARSLVLARRAHPILVGVAVGPDGTLTGLVDPDDKGAALHEAAMAVVARLVELVFVLVGEDLAIRLVRSAWPWAEKEQT